MSNPTSVVADSRPIIALDYDGTCTTDIPFWEQFAIAARTRGYRVFLVTMRRHSEVSTISPAILTAVDALICTSRKAKKAYLQSQGISVAIWIDDQPEALFEDFS